MPSLTVGKDVEFFYLDSGAVPNESYTTIVTVHGLGFNGAVFERLLPIAPKHGLRVVSLYRRDYAPSSPFTDAELRLMSGDVQEQKQFLDHQGLLMAEFLDRFIRENHLPPTGPNQSGGVVLLGWSQGANTVNAMLSSLDTMSKEMIGTFEAYLHTVLYYEPPPGSVGLPGPPEFRPAFFALETVEDRFNGFGEWVAAYYDHQDIHSQDNNQLEHFVPSPSKPISLYGPPEVSNLKKYISLDAFGGSDGAWVFMNPTLPKEAAVRAWFDAGNAQILPGLRIRILSCGQTPAALLWTAWEIDKAARDPSLWGGEKGRDVKVTIKKEGNHFLFWDEPEEALRVFKQCIHQDNGSLAEAFFSVFSQGFRSVLSAYSFLANFFYKGGVV